MPDPERQQPRPALCAALATAAVTLFNWPLLSATGGAGPAAQFVYLFAAWGGVVGALAWIGRPCRPKRRGEGSDV
ncbi:MAG: hypothetical protein Kow0092_03950 [Deferrisomatales bacterium]